MKTKIVEAGNHLNWGKFLLGRMDVEYQRRSAEGDPDDHRWPLLGEIGWNPNQLWVLDLQTCEGAAFSVTPHGYPTADLEKHRVWVCPMFEPFLGWLYQQDVTDLDALPDYVNLFDAPSALAGYRRPGPEPPAAS